LTPTVMSDFSSFFFSFWYLMPKGEKIRGVNRFSTPWVLCSCALCPDPLRVGCEFESRSKLYFMKLATLWLNLLRIWTCIHGYCFSLSYYEFRLFYIHMICCRNLITTWPI
jgi:hypothetical protein